MTPLHIPALLQSAYAFAAASILLASNIPFLRARFIGYGKTAAQRPPQTNATFFDKLLDVAAVLTVPHSWFIHFYVTAVLTSLFFAWQLFTKGVVFRALSAGAGLGMRIEQVVLAWCCFLAQGARRLYECLYVQKHGDASKSRMWIAHYVVGIGFYASMAVAVWIEGASAINAFTFSPSSLQGLVAAPSVKTFVALITFFMASGVQHDCHVYLASLQKYSLPTHPFFMTVLCPHYSAECVIYFSLAILAAPSGMILNRTIAAATVFVVAILSVSASENRRWYISKFGEEKVKGRWTLIPGVY